jgi:NTE family protein
MIAFVLSGGASLTTIQAGMLKALLERDIVPDARLGTSIGAANAAFLAAEPALPTSTHEGFRRGDHAPVEEVVRLGADLSIA